MTTLPTLTIFSTILNEESNILLFLGDLLLQDLPGFRLEKILLISDGSTDRTVELVKTVADPRIEILEEHDRQGKNARMNQGLRLATSDIVILLDADIRMRKPHALHALVEPFVHDPLLAVTSGWAIPLEPQTLAEHVAWVSDALWKNILDHTKNTDMYRCEGKVRAIHRNLYKDLVFPLASADDVYPYLQAKKHGMGFLYCKNATVRYQLPVTWGDYTKQNIRFLQSKDIQSHFFDDALLSQGYVVTTWDKVRGLIRFFPSHPYWTLLYVLSAIYNKVISHFPYDDKAGKWDLVTTTKKLRKMD